MSFNSLFGSFEPQQPPTTAGNGLLGFLFQGAPSQTFTSSASAGPAWLQQAIYNMTGAAGQLASQPYQSFPGPQIAAPSAQTQQAWQLAGQNVGDYKPFLQQAGALTSAAAKPITADAINQFVNPYQNYITKEMDTNLQQNILPGIQDKFVSAGQSRSPQEAQITGQAAYNTQQAVGQSLAGAYQGAVNSLLQSRGQMANEGAEMGQLGALTQQLGSGDVANLAAAGQAQDTLGQANINAAMQNFQNQTNWPYQNLGFLSNILRGIPLGAVGSMQQSSGTYYPQSASGLGSYLGAGAMASGMGYKRGGPVRGALSHAMAA